MSSTTTNPKKRKAEDPKNEKVSKAFRTHLIEKGKYFCDNCYEEIPYGEALHHPDPKCSWTTCQSCYETYTEEQEVGEEDGELPFLCQGCGETEALRPEDFTNNRDILPALDGLSDTIDIVEKMIESGGATVDELKRVQEDLEETRKIGFRVLNCLYNSLAVKTKIMEEAKEALDTVVAKGFMG